MKFSESWLRTLVNPSWTTQQLADRLTMAGIEVEALQPVAPDFKGVVVAEVLSAEKHPEADRLKVLSVNVGQSSPLQIVCGANNVVVGMKAPCAMVGAELPGGFAIKEAKLRGIPSFGMMCSEKELGLKDEAQGLMVLPEDAPVGQDIREYLELDDTLITLKLTPNRADCLGLLGVAREVAALSGSPLDWQSPVAAVIDTMASPLVINHIPTACPLYFGRSLELAQPGAPTPTWMKQRLERSGMRSHNLVVDVTNYVLLEMGQPLHAFDQHKIKGDIHIRWAHPEEGLRLINDQEVKLNKQVLVIADDEKPLAIAGIMGGAESAVNLDTTKIFLEAAFFTPESIAGRARAFTLSTDSSHRFERGVDFAKTEQAIERATELLLQYAGGRAGELVVSEHSLPQRPTCLVRPQRVERILGIKVDATRITELLTRLGITVSPSPQGLSVTPPSYRFDLSIEEDYIEEIARLVGYDEIPELPPVGPLIMLQHQDNIRTDGWFQDQLVARDFQEVITYSFIDKEWQESSAGEGRAIELLNPIASHLALMRQSLWPGLLDTLKTNLAKQAERLRVFEIGRCFYKNASGDICQPKKLAALAYGPRYSEQWGEASRDVDFFDLKADLETLLSGFNLSFTPSKSPLLHPGRQAEVWVNGLSVGLIGETHPQLTAQLALPKACQLFEIDLSGLQPIPLPQYREPSKFPQVKRDLALLVADNQAVGELLGYLKERQQAPIQDIYLFDLYRGPGVPDGKKSLAFRIVMQDTEKTLTDNEIDQAVSHVLTLLKSEFHAELR